MVGFSINQRPDAPVGTPEARRTQALHWHWTTEYTNAEIAAALGVTERTVERYLDEPPADEVREQLADVETQVRYIAVAELQDQLKAAGHRAKTAEAPAEVWTDDDGNLRVRDVRDDAGDVVERVPIPDDLDLMPDEEARYYARAEVRDILDQLTDLLGIGEPEQLEVEHSGQIDREHTLGEDEKDLALETLRELQAQESA
jgi:hypothetical protein